MESQSPEYELIYWPFLPGRGEFVRLIFEEVQVAYTEVAREPSTDRGGVKAVMAYREGSAPGRPVYAPPILRHREELFSQTSVICAYLGERFSLNGESRRWVAAEVFMNIMDCVDEVHDTHHPIAVADYYEDQKPEALKKTRAFLEQRLPLRLRYLERVLEHHAGDWLLGNALTYPDLALFQFYAGLRYAFPAAMDSMSADFPRVQAVHDAVTIRPAVVDYLGSARRISFNEHGVFRYYEELDLAPSAG